MAGEAHEAMRKSRRQKSPNLWRSHMVKDTFKTKPKTEIQRLVFHQTHAAFLVRMFFVSCCCCCCSCSCSCCCSCYSFCMFLLSHLHTFFEKTRRNVLQMSHFKRCTHIVWYLGKIFSTNANDRRSKWTTSQSDGLHSVALFQKYFGLEFIFEKKIHGLITSANSFRPHL